MQRARRVGRRAAAGAGDRRPEGRRLDTGQGGEDAAHARNARRDSPPLTLPPSALVTSSRTYLPRCVGRGMAIAGARSYQTSPPAPPPRRPRTTHEEIQVAFNRNIITKEDAANYDRALTKHDAGMPRTLGDEPPAAMPSNEPTASDEFLTQLIKFIPVEILAFYTLIASIISANTDDGASRSCGCSAPSPARWWSHRCTCGASARSCGRGRTWPRPSPSPCTSSPSAGGSPPRAGTSRGSARSRWRSPPSCCRSSTSSRCPSSRRTSRATADPTTSPCRLHRSPVRRPPAGLLLA